MSIRSELFRHRSTMLLLLVFPILAWTLEAPPPTGPELVVGLALLALGAALRLASARCLGRGARVHRAGARGGLVHWGPYAWSRNPLYVAAACILAGLSLMAGSSWWGLLVLPATFLLYLPVVLHEEIAIRESVGPDFDEYRRAVPRWVGWTRTMRSEGADGAERSPWQEVLRREKGLIPGLLLGAGGITLVQHDMLPLRSLCAAVGARLGLPCLAVAALGLGLGAVGNSLAVERKRRRHDGRREAKAKAKATAEARRQGQDRPDPASPVS